MSENDYQVGGNHYPSEIQHWDYCLANNLPYMEGQITKYVTRWRKKNGIQDLQKAQHFLAKLIESEHAKKCINCADEVCPDGGACTNPDHQAPAPTKDYSCTDPEQCQDCELNDTCLGLDADGTPNPIKIPVTKSSPEKREEPPVHIKEVIFDILRQQGINPEECELEFVEPGDPREILKDAPVGSIYTHVEFARHKPKEVHDSDPMIHRCPKCGGCEYTMTDTRGIVLCLNCKTQYPECPETDSCKLRHPETGQDNKPKDANRTGELH